jgi:drug/metabolite transporter (DMT)-like permease
MALGVAVLDERMGPMQLLGAALVVSGVALVSLRRAAA